MNDKINQLSELIGLILSDGKVKEEEYNFLIKIAREMGISQVKVDCLFGKESTFSPPKNEFDRIVQFYRLVLLMNVDKDTNLNELDYIKDLAIRMGLNPLATNKILEIMEQYPEKKVPVDVLIGIFKENHN